MAAALDAPGLDRPLGFTEALCARWYQAIPRGLQVVAAALCTDPVERDQLVAAVDRIRVRHPGAASRIVEDTGGGLRFAAAASDAVEVAEAAAGTRWRDRFTAQLATSLDLGRALWRVELVPSPADDHGAAVVIVAGCHALLDGISAATVLRELLHEVDDAAPGFGLPAMEDRLPASTRPAAPGVSPAAHRWPVVRRAPSGERTYVFSDRVVAADTVSALTVRAHAERTTIAALLAVACARARTVVPGALDHVGFNVPYDVRPRVHPPIPERAVGAYFGRAHVYTSGAASDADPWAAARDVSAQLADELAAMVQPPAWSERTISALLEDLCRDDRSSFDLSVMLTDLGACELGPSVARFFLTTVQTTGVEAFVVSAATPRGGELCLGVGWPRPLVDDTTAHRFADELVVQLGLLAYG